MKLEYEITNEDYLKFNMHYLDNSADVKRSLFISRIMLTIITLGVAFLTIRDGSIYGYLYFALIWLVIMVFFKKYFRYFMERKLKKMIKDGKNKGFLGQSSLEVQEDGLYSTSQNAEQKTKWEGVQKIATTSEHIFIYVGELAAIIVPLSSFQDDAQKEEFLQLLNSKVNIEM